MRTIAIINQKGGCGKTTVSINLAATLAARGQRTLLVDMDPQAHCAMGLAVPEGQIERSVADLLRAGLDGSLGVEEITWQISRHLDLAPSGISLAGLEQQLGAAADRDRRLAQVLSPAAERYDFCIIDCPPAIGLLTFNALRAADEVLIPVETGYFSMQGSVRQEQTIEMLARRAGHHVRFKVLATMYDVRTKLAREILGELRRHFTDKLLPVVINFNAKLKEAASFGQPITEYDAASRGMQDFERLAAWLIENPPAHRGELAAAHQNPALSRAAELVERARGLSARTAELAARLREDEEVPSPGRDASATDPATDPEADPDADPKTPVPAGSVLEAAPPHAEPAPDAVAPRAESARPGLGQQLARLFGVRSTHQGLLFVQPADRGRHVAIAADFNGWDPQLTPMTRDERLGVWQACVQVPPGRYRYRLVVDGQWTPDPYNQATEPDDRGELSNVVELAAGN